MRLFSLKGVFFAAVAIGVGHYGITGMEDALTSAFVGVHAGWGALAYDVYGYLAGRTRNPPSNEKDVNNYSSTAPKLNQ